MSIATISIVSATFLFIAILPKIFFRADGKFNLKWFVTGAPYFFAPLFVILTEMGFITPLIGKTSAAYPAMEIIAVAFFFTSSTLMGMTLGTHRVPLALWHQKNDAPRSIVTFGAYAKIRHPFYTSFIVALIGAVLIAPSIYTFATLGFGFVALNVTAAKEEKKLSSSEFGPEYQKYVTRTNRFFPNFG